MFLRETLQQDQFCKGSQNSKDFSHEILPYMSLSTKYKVQLQNHIIIILHSNRPLEHSTFLSLILFFLSLLSFLHPFKAINVSFFLFFLSFYPFFPFFSLSKHSTFLSTPSFISFFFSFYPFFPFFSLSSFKAFNVSFLLFFLSFYPFFPFFSLSKH
jgi:hypothetical protein